MPKLRLRRRLAPWVAVFFAANGCASGLRTLGRDDLVEPEPAQYYVVTPVSGDSRTFISLHLEGETLFGTERVTTEVTEGEGAEARTSVWNRYEEVQMPWSDVAKVEAETKKKGDTGILLAAGGLVVGVTAFLLLSQSESNAPPDDGGGGKEP